MLAELIINQTVHCTYTRCQDFQVFSHFFLLMPVACIHFCLKSSNFSSTAYEKIVWPFVLTHHSPALGIFLLFASRQKWKGVNIMQYKVSGGWLMFSTLGWAGLNRMLSLQQELIRGWLSNQTCFRLTSWWHRCALTTLLQHFCRFGPEQPD